MENGKGTADFFKLLSGDIAKARQLMVIEMVSVARTDIAFLVELKDKKMAMFAIRVKNREDPGLQNSLYSVTPGCQFLTTKHIPAMISVIAEAEKAKAKKAAEAEEAGEDEGVEEYLSTIRKRDLPGVSKGRVAFLKQVHGPKSDSLLFEIDNR